MKRRVLAVAAAAATALAIVPALPAAAAIETGTASLTVGRDVFPDPGQPQTYKVAVNNTSPSAAVNAVRLTFPPSAVGVTAALTQPLVNDGWTVVRASNGSSLFFSGGSIPARSTFEFSFSSDVARPAVDRAGKFTVTLSQDGGATGYAADEASNNALRTTVRVLQVLDKPVPTAPVGVRDGSATGGQSITYEYSVKNHGSAALAVTPVLSSSNSGDTVTNPTSAVSIGSEATQAFSFPVKLAGADGGDRTSTFTATASAKDGTTTTATAPSQIGSLSVQKPALLPLGKVAPNVVRPGISYPFTGTLTKSGAPSLTVNSGSLSFAKTTALLNSSHAIGDSTAKELTFGPAQVVGDGSAATAFQPDGDNKSYGVTAAFNVTDDNGFTYDISNTLSNGIRLDALAPVVKDVAASLPADADGARQTAAKDGDTIGVSGLLEKSCSDVLDFVELRQDTGTATRVTVTKGAPTPDGSCSFSGSAKVASFDFGAQTFKVVAQASDAAANTGTGESLAVIIDNVAPALTFSQTVSSTRIGIRFTEQNKVLGGCNPTQYKVDGDPLVAQVLYSNGTPCQTGQAGPDNERILVLSTPKPEEFTSTLQYTPGTDAAKDGAGLKAAAAIVNTVQGVVPAPPVLGTAKRNGGTETAFAETENGVTTYFTRFNGDDLLLEFTGGKPGYSVRVTDGVGTALRTAPAGGSPSTVRIPLGSGSEGTYDFRLQLLNQSAIPSDPVPFKVVLDQTLPTMTGAQPGLAVNGSTSAVVVSFSEFLAAGTDFAFDWTVVQDGSFLAVKKVTVTDRKTRTLETQGAVNATKGVNAVYELVTSGKRYEDRAGNTVRNGTA